MIDIMSDHKRFTNAHTLCDMFIGKQIADAREAWTPAGAITFTDGTRVTISEATMLPDGTYIPEITVGMYGWGVDSWSDEYEANDRGHIARAWATTASRRIGVRGISAPLVHRTITLWAITDKMTRPEKLAEISGEYAAHSDLRPTLILESSDGTTINAADAALKPQW